MNTNDIQFKPLAFFDPVPPVAPYATKDNSSGKRGKKYDKRTKNLKKQLNKAKKTAKKQEERLRKSLQEHHAAEVKLLRENAVLAADHARVQGQLEVFQWMASRNFSGTQSLNNAKMFALEEVVCHAESL